MELKDKINELKEEILMRFRMFPDCYIHDESTPNTESIICTLEPLFSRIEFDKKDLTSPTINISIDNVEYYARVRIPSKKLAKRYLVEAKRAESISDFLSIIEDLLSYEIEGEYVTITIFESKPKTEPEAKSVKLDLSIIGEEKVELDVDIYIVGHMVEHLVIFDNIRKELIYNVELDYRPIIYHELSLREAPEVLKSLIEYAIKISNYNEYLRLFDAVRKLINLVKEKKYSIEDAIKELKEKHGYWDIFG